MITFFIQNDTFSLDKRYLFKFKIIPFFFLNGKKAASCSKKGPFWNRNQQKINFFSQETVPTLSKRIPLFLFAWEKDRFIFKRGTFFNSNSAKIRPFFSIKGIFQIQNKKDCFLFKRGMFLKLKSAKVILFVPKW